MTRTGIAAEQFRTLGLAPQVEVAWADGLVDFAERSAVIRFAKRKSWLTEGGDALVEGWLKQRPGAAFLDDAHAAVCALTRGRRGRGNAFPEDT